MVEKDCGGLIIFVWTWFKLVLVFVGLVVVVYLKVCFYVDLVFRIMSIVIVVVVGWYVFWGLVY